MSVNTQQSPLLHQTSESFWCVSTITIGDAVTWDSTVSTSLDYAGVKTTPATADLAPVIGIALETVTGTTAAPVKVKVATHGRVNKIKIGAGVIATDPLVTLAVAGQMGKAAAGDISGARGAALTATNTLLDGTTDAGFCGGWLY